MPRPPRPAKPGRPYATAAPLLASWIATHGYTLSELAAMTGVPRRTWGRWLARDSRPSPAMVRLLKQAWTDIPIDRL